MKFRVTTVETVEGTYEVEAADVSDAMTRLVTLPRDWEGIEQIDYQAFEVKVEGMTVVG
jgi:hypothetical protein